GHDDRARAGERHLSTMGVTAKQKAYASSPQKRKPVRRVAHRDLHAHVARGGEGSITVGVAGPWVVQAEDRDIVVGRREPDRVVDEHARAGALEGGLEQAMVGPEIVVAEDGDLGDARGEGGDAALELAGARPGGVEEHV